MSRKILAGLSAVALVAVFCGAVLAEDLVDNPGYAMWSKHKPGTTVKYKTTVTAPNMNNTTETTQTLKEVTADKVVIEMAVPSMNTPPMKSDIPAKIAKDKLPENMANCKELGKGDEEIKVGDKAYKCQWKEYEVTIQAGEQKFVTKSKVWICNDVPGGVIKTATETTGAMASKSEMLLVEFTAGK
ncbi:MAG: hypothetical protein HZA50_10985 [Planctomycetes bacterium]|nr:hypothetical protein [Planctomycetota bacterium]